MKKSVIKKINQSTTIEELINLWNIVANNKYSYSLVELWDIIDLIKEKSLKVYGRDIDKGKFYNALDKMKTKQNATL